MLSSAPTPYGEDTIPIREITTTASSAGAPLSMTSINEYWRHIHMFKCIPKLPLMLGSSPSMIWRWFDKCGGVHNDGDHTDEEAADASISCTAGAPAAWNQWRHYLNNDGHRAPGVANGTLTSEQLSSIGTAADITLTIMKPNKSTILLSDINQMYINDVLMALCEHTSIRNQNGQLELSVHELSLISSYQSSSQPCPSYLPSSRASTVLQTESLSCMLANQWRLSSSLLPSHVRCVPHSLCIYGVDDVFINHVDNFPRGVIGIILFGVGNTSTSVVKSAEPTPCVATYAYDDDDSRPLQSRTSHISWSSRFGEWLAIPWNTMYEVTKVTTGSMAFIVYHVYPATAAYHSSHPSSSSGVMTMTPSSILSSDIASSVSSRGVSILGNDISNATGELRKRKDASVSAKIAYPLQGPPKLSKTSSVDTTRTLTSPVLTTGVVPLPSTPVLHAPSLLSAECVSSWAVPTPHDLISGAYRMARTSQLLLPTIDQTFSSSTSSTTTNQIDEANVKTNDPSPRPVSNMNGRRAPISQLRALQFGILLNDIQSSIPNELEVKGRDLITIGILQRSLLDTGIASSMITYPVAVEFNSSRALSDQPHDCEEHFEHDEHDKPDATARVYPLGDRELSWLHHRYRTPPAASAARYSVTAHSTCSSSSSSIEDMSKHHRHRKFNSGSSSGGRTDTCNIPFYHLTNKYPAGHRVIFNEKLEHHEVHGDGNALNIKETVEALIISSAVIVTLKPLSVLIMDHLPSNITPLLSCILQYLPSINNWTVDAVDVSTLPVSAPKKTPFCLASDDDDDIATDNDDSDDDDVDEVDAGTSDCDDAPLKQRIRR